MRVPILEPERERESKEKMYLQSCCMIAESEAALRCWDSIVLDSVVFINR